MMNGNNEKKKQNRTSFFKNYRLMKQRKMQYSIMKHVGEFFGIVLAILFVLFLMSGIINQRRTGETLVNYALDIGKRVSVVLHSIYEGDGPVDVNEDGVYLKK